MCCIRDLIAGARAGLRSLGLAPGWTLPTLRASDPDRGVDGEVGRGSVVACIQMTTPGAVESGGVAVSSNGCVSAVSATGMPG